MKITEQSKSWHHYPLVWMLFSIPFSAVIMGVVMISLALNTEDGLVADDYYKLGKEINRVISRDKRATELGLSATIEFDNTTRVVSLRFDKGILDAYPKTMPLHIQHATRENSDIVVWLDHGIGDQYIGRVSQSISEGVWYFKLADKGKPDSEWKLNTRSYVRSKNTVYLRSDN